MASIRHLAADEYIVREIVTLKMAEDGTALSLLQAVAKQVQPILRRRQWTVSDECYRPFLQP